MGSRADGRDGKMVKEFGQLEIDKDVLRISKQYGSALGIVEDLAQDMRLMLLDGENPRYLRRKVIDILRSRKYRYTERYRISYGITDLLMVNDSGYRQAVINQFLESLSIKDRVIAKYRLSGYTCKEIAGIIHKSESMVSKKISGFIKALLEDTL